MISSERPLKVLHVAINLDRRRGGAVQAMMTVCRGLHEQGVQVEVAAPYRPKDRELSLTLDYPEIPHHLFPSSFPGRFNNSSGLRHWLTRHVNDYDFVEIHEVFAFPPVIAGQVCRVASVPYLLNPHGSLMRVTLQNQGFLKRIIRGPMLRPLIEGAAVLKMATTMEVTQSDTFGQRVKTVVSPLPVEPVPGGDRKRFRRKHGIPDDATVFLCVARLHPVKGLEMLIPALGMLKQEIPKLWFVLAGSGDKGYVAGLRSLLTAHGLAERSVLPGFLSEQTKGDAFAAADLYVQLSFQENYSITVAEAASASLPVIVSDQIGLAQQVIAAGAGWVCQPTTESALMALRNAWANRFRWADMGKYGRNWFYGHLHTPKVIQELTSLYQTVTAISCHANLRS